MTLRPGYGIRLDSARRLLAEHSPFGTLEAQWPAGRVRISAYFGQVQLPPEIPHRVRCLVAKGAEVLVIWDVFGVADCFPGGGVEPGETVTEAACREVLEETGWHIDPRSIDVLGWIHIRSFAEPSANHPFPHPDGFMTVVHARALRAETGHAEWHDSEGFVTKSAFMHVSELPDTIRHSPVHGPYLERVFGDVWRALTP